jgi:hypothetical protein
LSITNGGSVSSQSGFIAHLGGPAQLFISNGGVKVDGNGSTWTIGGSCDWRFSVSGVQATPNDGGTALCSITNGGQIVVNNTTNSGPISPPVVSVGVSGTLTGDGTFMVNGQGYFFASMVVLPGTLAPDGNLQINGNLSLSSNFGSATTLCHVTPQEADNVTVSGTALLGGRLIVILDGTFPQPEESCIARFTLLHTDGGRNNTLFNSVSIQGIPPDPPFTAQITYDSNNVYLDLVFCE